MIVWQLGAVKLNGQLGRRRESHVVIPSAIWNNVHHVSVNQTVT